MKDRLYAILEVLLIAILIFSIYKLIGYGIEYIKGDNVYDEAEEFIVEEDEKEEENPEKFEINLKGLKEVNPDICGWIRIPDTPVNYPLLQPTDNEYYLKHTYNNIYSDFGSIFIDCNCTMESGNTIIYGHNMKNQSMFGTLRKYYSNGNEYVTEHPYIYIIYDNAEYKYQIVSAFVANADDVAYTINFESDESREQWLNKMLSRSYFKVERENEDSINHFITLSTCTSRTSMERRIIIAERVERIY